MSRETSAHMVNSVCLEIFVVSFLIGAFLANMGFDWFIRNIEMPRFLYKVGESERGSWVKRFLLVLVCHVSYVWVDYWWERKVA